MSINKRVDNKQACNPKAHIQAINENIVDESISFIPLSPEISKKLGKNAFALQMQDDSMTPDINMGDLLIIDPDQTIRPGGLVVVQIQENIEVTVRRYKQLSTTQTIQDYELLSTNENWANIRASQSSTNKFIGVVLGYIRIL